MTLFWTYNSNISVIAVVWGCPLNPTTLIEAGVRCGSSALVAEARKYNANDSKCAECGWVCIPLAVESYGC